MAIAPSQPFSSQSLPRSASVPHPRFCLVTGAPRSGTSAVSSWLGRHPGVAGFFESRVLIACSSFLNEMHRFRSLVEHSEPLTQLMGQMAEGCYAKAENLEGKELILDKEPLEPIAFPEKQYRDFLRNTRLMFPDLRLLFLLREPVATVWSMTRRTWGQSLVDFEPKSLTLEEHLENWCACAELILELAEDPAVYVCPIARLVEEPEHESRRVFEFLGLSEGEPFEPRETKSVEFSGGDREQILEKARPYLESFRELGLMEG